MNHVYDGFIMIHGAEEKTSKLTFLDKKYSKKKTLA